MKRIQSFFLIPLWLGILVSCSEELVVIDGNTPFSTFNVSDIKVENYVNRLYIDILGREPLDDELVIEVDRLKAGGLQLETRDSIIVRLMTDTTFRENEFSYKAAYIQNLYTQAKVRCLEGAADSDIQLRINILRQQSLQDSLEGNWDPYYVRLYEIQRNELVLDSRQTLFDGLIQYHQMYAFMIDNAVYDAINMNSFNYIRASFDQLVWRLPSDQEFDQSFKMIEFNQNGQLFGALGTDKNDYIRILTESTEMFEGMIIWTFQTFLSRPPTPAEMVTLLPAYIQTQDINSIIAKLLVTDEYANFR